MKQFILGCIFVLLTIPLFATYGENMRITVHSNGKITVFQLNNSQAAKELYDQLPLSIEVENYSHNEKIFYPPKQLNTSNTPLANAKNGTLAYYAPWGNVVMFYKDFGTASGLYELGEAVSGVEHIKNMYGTIEIKK
ncbi:MAG TPA: cyclophilin-like fold protein [Sulfurovum sp.]